MQGVIQTDDSIIINVSFFVKHDGYSHRVESLMYAIHSIKDSLKNKKLVFRISDGEPIRLAAFESVMHQLVKLYNLDRVTFEMIDHTPRLCLDNVDINIHHTHFFRKANIIANTEYKLDDNACDFGIFLGRFSIPRLLLASFVETRLSNSLVGFQPNFDWTEFETEATTEFFQEEIDWHKNRKSKNTTIESEHNGCVSTVPNSYILKDYKNIWGKYKLEIVVETNTYDYGWFTEKTTKCLASGKPFILFGTQGQMQQLRDIGFKTFSPWINEDYDNESNQMERLELVKQELLRINSIADKTDFYKNIYDVANYNRKIYSEVINRYYRTPL